MLRQLLSLFLTCILTLSAQAQSGLNADLLPADEAFALSVSRENANTLVATFSIADDYYLYRDKISFEFIGDGLKGSAAPLPPGIIKEDPTFGTVATFLHELTVPLTFQNPQKVPFTLIVRSQGCNEPIGVCYAPQVQQLNFNADAKPEVNLSQLLGDPFAGSGALNASSANGEVSGSQITDSTLQATNFDKNNAPTPNVNNTQENNSLQNRQLKQTLDNTYTQKDFLPVHEAFTITLDQDPLQPDFINFRINIAPGYYLYRDKTRLQQEQNNVALTLPGGDMKDDPYFGQVEILRHSFTLAVATALLNRGEALTLSFQGCAEDGICYAPTHLRYTFQNNQWQTSETSRAASLFSFFDIENKSLLHIMALALLAGLLLTFTPCVLPLIPILSAVIVGQKTRLTGYRAGILASVYVSGTIATYALMGAIAGATGAQLQAYFQNVWAVGALAFIFILTALAMLGVFTIAMPNALQSRLHHISQRLTGSLSAVFALGFVSALIVGACVSPVLIAFLSVAISKGDAALGATMMASMALGMGIPLIIYGFGAGQLIPKAGRWMQVVNVIFAILLLFVALYLLGTLPQFPILIGWAALFIIGGFYLWQLANRFNKHYLPLTKGASILVIVWGIAMLLGASMGQRNPFNPLPINSLMSSAPSPSQALEFISVADDNALDQQISRAMQTNKIVMIDYYADWCLDCVRMKKTTFTDSQVVQTLQQHFISVEVDVTDAYKQSTNALKQRFNVFGPPAFIFIQNGQVLDEASFYGYKSPQDMTAHLKGLL